MKLSCMLLFFMKALCTVEMMEFMRGARRSANSLAMILVKEWIKLIGRKSVMDSAPSFLGIKTTLAEFRMSRLPIRNE